MIHFEKRFRSLNARNFVYVGQRAAKLLAVKVGVLKKKSAISAIQAEVCASAFGPGLSTPRVKSFSKYVSQQLVSPLIYTPLIFSTSRSKPLFHFVKNSRNWQHFKGLFCPVKVTLFS